MVRIHAIESLRVPGEGSSAQGKSGPKERPKSVSDGQQVEIPALRRFPGEGSSAQGKSGPKERPKGVSDGQQVEIPAPPIYLKSTRDTGVKGKRGRGKTRIERYSEK